MFIFLLLNILYLNLIQTVSNNLLPDNLMEYKTALRNSKFHNFNFEEVTTVGSNCYTKIRVKYYLDKFKKNISNPNHLFDWMMPINYTLFGDAILNNFNDSFGVDCIQVLNNRSGVGAVLYNEKYKFAFTHSFDGIKEVSNQIGPKCLTQETFIKYYPLIAEKTTRMIEKSREAFTTSKRSLYVGSAVNPSFTSTQEDFHNFMRAVRLKRDENFLILILIAENIAKLKHFEFDKIIDGNLLFHKVKPYSWYSAECINQWNEFLQIILDQSLE